MFDDEYIAGLIARGCSYKPVENPVTSQLKRKHHSTETVNKQFLRNTILSTESHNKREEIADCWREHDLRKHVSDMHKASTDSDQKSAHADSQREYWASLKTNRSTETASNLQLEVSSNSEEEKQKKAKKQKKEKKEKKKNKKKKEEKTNKKQKKEEKVKRKKDKVEY